MTVNAAMAQIKLWTVFVSFCIGRSVTETADCCVYAAKSFLFAKKSRDVKHVGAFAFSHNGESKRVHHITQMVSFLFNPAEHRGSFHQM